VEDLKERLRGFGTVSVHLVLNLAYETSLLMAQVRAFDSLGIEDLILTHLDEETRWGKACDLVFGTNFPIRFLSAGQNVPGQFTAATAEVLLMPQVLRGQAVIR
jgi:flagellar biosynthesis protein FlhF